MLTAPYNFVPLADTVVCPSWAGQVQMEMPFPHALCGSFDLVIEAVTPLMVGGDAISPPEGMNAETTKRNFTLFDQPSLPGTTLKGALRAVIEIASFGKIGTRIDDQRFAVRDLQNPYLYTARFNEMFRPLSRAGWLEIERGTGEWRLRPCDYSLVRQVDLENLHGGRVQLGRRGLTATDKYRAWGRVPLDLRFDPDAWRARDDWAKGRIVSRADNVGRGRTSGTIVFTGQPNNRVDRGAKKVEFLFHSPRADFLPVPDSVREDFEHVHRNPNTHAPLRDWAEHRSSLIAGLRIPVFWLAAGEMDEQIVAMGLAMMFRLAYRHTTRQLAGRASLGHLSDKPDFAETLFGYVREGKTENKDRALAGRVHIESARLEHAVADAPTREEILLSPKPAFYPAYVAQRHLDPRSNPLQVRDGSYAADGKRRAFKAYTTYMDEQAVLHGWKRYPVSDQPRPSSLQGPDQPAVNSREVYTRFTPLGAGTRFRTTVHVHNLRPEELGALLWAICFGDPAKGYCHSVGMARPLGLGCVRITLDPDSIDIDDVDDLQPWHGRDAAARLDKCRLAFEAYMGEEKRDWAQSAQIRLLQAMADPALGSRKAAAGELAPMVGPGLFQGAKRDGLVLAPYIEVGDVWPPQAPPPSAGSVNEGVQPARGTHQSGRAPASRRTVSVDGERGEVLEQDGNRLYVRFANGDSEWISGNEVDPE